MDGQSERTAVLRGMMSGSLFLHGRNATDAELKLLMKKKVADADLVTAGFAPDPAGDGWISSDGLARFRKGQSSDSE